MDQLTNPIYKDIGLLCQHGSDNGIQKQLDLKQVIWSTDYKDNNISAVAFFMTIKLLNCTQDHNYMRNN